MKIHSLIRFFLKSLTWKIKGSGKKVYLTFDDGPVPQVTPWVLETLKSFNAKATFFCVGENVRKHPAIYESVLRNGHRQGNHTMNHENGWTTGRTKYYESVRKCNELVSAHIFRPPYGKISLAQYLFLKKKFRIIMWDVLSYDFDKEKSGDDCFLLVKKNTRPGSIIVFHDSIKAEKNLRHCLPLCLEYLRSAGYSFELIP